MTFSTVAVRRLSTPAYLDKAGNQLPPTYANSCQEPADFSRRVALTGTNSSQLEPTHTNVRLGHCAHIVPEILTFNPALPLFVYPANG